MRDHFDEVLACGDGRVACGLCVDSGGSRGASVNATVEQWWSGPGVSRRWRAVAMAPQPPLVEFSTKNFDDCPREGRRGLAVAAMSPKRKTAAAALTAGGVPPSSEPATPKRARQSRAEAVEKRMARFICSPSVAVRQRIQRAYQHRLYLIEKKMLTGAGESSHTGCEFFVLGATGNVYSVKLAKRPSCTCPDAAKGNICKHFLFVMLRVLKLPESDLRVWQKALLSNELEELLNMSATNAGVLANQLVRQRFHEITGTDPEPNACRNDTEKTTQRDLEGDCPICYEAMACRDGKPGEPVVFCKTCGNNVHRDCFERWSRNKRSTGDRVTCIYCRTDWDDIRSTKGLSSEADRSGYVNLASYSEGHAHQDTSLESLYPNSWKWIDSHSRRRF